MVYNSLVKYESVYFLFSIGPLANHYKTVYTLSNSQMLQNSFWSSIFLLDRPYGGTILMGISWKNWI